jgi:hypothetical protein
MKDPVLVSWPRAPNALMMRTLGCLCALVFRAWLLGALGQIDDAFDVLSRAEEEHQGLLCYTGQPGFDSLRADSRFTALRRRLQLPA